MDKENDVTDEVETVSEDHACTEQLEDEVISLINTLGRFEAREPSNLLEMDLGFDSLGLIILLTMIEEIFHIELDESDMNPFELRTVQNVIDLVAKYFDHSQEATDG
jgi:acyl carrier protein